MVAATGRRKRRPENKNPGVLCYVPPGLGSYPCPLIAHGKVTGIYVCTCRAVLDGFFGVRCAGTVELWRDRSGWRG
jgi:hypothetical protein